MPRKYVRKKPPLDLSQATAAVSAARRWIKTHKKEAGVPWKALAEPFASGGVTAGMLKFRTMRSIAGIKVQPLPGREPVLGRKVDAALGDWARTSAAVGLPPTELQVRTKACRIARTMKVSFKSGLPGKDYLAGFRQRHHLSLRKPTGLSAARKMASADPESLSTWHEVTWTKVRRFGGEWRGRACQLKLTKVHARMQALDTECMDGKTFRECPDRIFNLDEAGIQRQPTHNNRVLAGMGQKVVFMPSDGNKESATLIAIGSADGTVLPPAYIMQGQCHMSNYLGKCHHFPGSGLFLKKETHMMDGQVWIHFLQWLTQQIPGGVSVAKKALLVVDGHESRLSLDGITEAIRLGFEVVVLPPNTTHFLQPWDQCFGAFRRAYSRLFTERFVTSALQLDKSSWLSLVDAAVYNTFSKSPHLLQQAFEKTGLVPQSPELTLQAAKICMQQEVPKPTVDKATLPHDLQAELHVPVEHLQLQRSRQPQQEKRKMLRIDGFVTQEGWSQAFNQNAKAKAAAAPGPSQPKKKCGRPPGSKNKKKLVEEDSD
jgi:hypothetical protein